MMMNSTSEANHPESNLGLSLEVVSNSVRQPLQNLDATTTVDSSDDDEDLKELTFDSLVGNSDLLLLENIINDIKTPWQIHNCKILDQKVTQDIKLAFLYHYDSLPEEIKNQKPLTMDLLKNFEKPMYATEASELLNLSPELIPVPWQVKVTGTMVMFFESLQIALRLKFTNTAKPYDPIYTKIKEDALKSSMQSWHFYGDVFVLNKNKQPLIMTNGDQLLTISSAKEYQALPAEFAIATLTLLEQQKPHIPQIEEAIQARL